MNVGEVKVFEVFFSTKVELFWYYLHTYCKHFFALVYRLFGFDWADVATLHSTVYHLASFIKYPIETAQVFLLFANLFSVLCSTIFILSSSQA